MDYTDLTVEQLRQERNKFQAKIDGPENDGRVTSQGSASLDYWIDIVEEIGKEIERRKNRMTGEYHERSEFRHS